ncbi:DUF624 domain-containing protein [Domibacillus sp. PGB-M46]|uniref:YesL family protein n=1 Tax=Domibacillus sp. PGB-M46 TaxID=2910255 RepID=UPI001F59C71D|nr:DUF624 domain-containing protein [Domibacillus sp. PGB-M46]MCI2255812.1 DUF624 domain-containing protein [Domibacillus sp. PGB-M46]
MNGWSGKTAGLMKPVANVLILNVLWLIGCLPLITIGPSTAAVLAVLREWQATGDDSVVRGFFRFFQLHFKQGFLIGNSWLVVGVILAADLFFVFHLPSGWNIVLVSFVGTICLIWLLVSTALFPCMIHYKKTGLDLLKTSFIIAFLDFQTACGILLFWVAAGLLFWLSPVLMLFSFVLISYATVRFSLRSFEQLERREALRLKHD